MQPGKIHKPEKQSFKSEVLRGLTSTAGICSNWGGAEIFFYYYAF